MARIFNTKYDELSLGEKYFYDAVVKRLPDYVYATFGFSIDNKEIDCLLMIPHLGVFVVELKSYTNLSYENGYFYTVRNGEAVHIKLDSAVGYSYILKKYFWENFHIKPFICDITCFTRLVMDVEIQQNLAIYAGLDPERVISFNDIKNGANFLAGLLDCYSSFLSCELYRENEFYRYSDIDDELANDIAKYWNGGIIEAPRPDKPPMLFISYSSVNSIVAKEIQKKIEHKYKMFSFVCETEILCGDDFEPTLYESLEECDGLVLLLSASSQDSAWVKKEFETALSLNKTIFPVLIEEFEMNDYYKKALTHHQFKRYSVEDDSVINDIYTLMSRNGLT